MGTSFQQLPDIITPEGDTGENRGKAVLNHLHGERLQEQGE